MGLSDGCCGKLCCKEKGDEKKAKKKASSLDVTENQNKHSSDRKPTDDPLTVHGTQLHHAEKAIKEAKHACAEGKRKEEEKKEKEKATKEKKKNEEGNENDDETAGTMFSYSDKEKKSEEENNNEDKKTSAAVISSDKKKESKTDGGKSDSNTDQITGIKRGGTSENEHDHASKSSETKEDTSKKGFFHRMGRRVSDKFSSTKIDGNNVKSEDKTVTNKGVKGSAGTKTGAKGGALKSH